MMTNHRQLEFKTGERGFTMIELLVATVVSLLVLGGAVALTSQVQTGYRRQIEASAGEQEGRYALEWIGKLIRGADNDPFNVILVGTTDCPAPATVYRGIRFDPDGDLVDNDIRLQTDSNPPDGRVGGVPGLCNQANEDVTISFDAANRAILFFDNNLGVPASIRTDAVIQDLRFVYRDAMRAVTNVEANVRYVEVQITIRTRTIDPSTGAPVTRLLSSEIRVRSR
jgi:prepilin-type N-terminal cleavage/methylation domain-containing protein